MFDSHCHPTDIEDSALVVRAACEAGVLSLLACGYNCDSNQAVIRLRQRFPGLPIAIGVHPWFADESTDGLAALIAGESPIAVGECGLDGKLDEPIPSELIQRRTFEAQLEIAYQLRLPVTVHSRRAAAQVLEMIGNFPSVRGVMHAFGGSYEQAKAFVGRGWLIGIGGAVTRHSAHRVHQLAQRLPIDSVVLETDAPAIGLDGVNPPDVRPSHLPRVAKALAALRGVDMDELSAATDENAQRIFGSNVLCPVRFDGSACG
jgi:TatD DNase family protein